MATEVLFYHLTSQPLEAVLPGLLMKCLERDWTVVVQCGSRERVEALDAHLWAFSDDSFLPHGTAADDHPEHQPVYLTDGPDNPNGAVIRFLVDRAVPGSIEGYARIVLLFDGQDPEALAEARGHWKSLKAQGAEVTYWQQKPNGGWERKA
ncbi:DNA polymerase III subunit chi [Microvirga tunisiensis]|uniref:DNA polymerase III subunit chi n=2 Tax=Pannonibacter tanglangensis TaxID=2750084 RepID=A0ABW9ZHC5_9HYPH|nr:MULTISPECIES: DNA polymerase III subunit chi [unclassified Pannonibacter]NBN64098.1 DNA polymerase III subunit chi [Pannonibacter sp. XCT-34]NBN77739.1 DNA polymerase III subunit chi [Pannonibacter sp. XCT-53]